jgi:hypothetical protein
MSELYDSEDEIPTADAEPEEDASVESPYLSWIGYSFVFYVLGAGAAGVVGLNSLYMAVMPAVLGLTFAVLVGLDARRIPDWGATKYLWALGSFFPPLVLGYYVRRGMVTA